MELKLAIIGGKHSGRELPVKAPEFLIGRGSQCQLQLKSHMVSRKHCAIALAGDEATIEDLGSTNGTLLNGEKIAERRTLKNGDRIKIGLLELEVRLAPVAAAAKASAAHSAAQPAAAGDDLDISGWLEEDAAAAEKPASLHDTSAAKTLDETVAIPIEPESAPKKPEHSPKSTGQFKQPAKPKSVNSHSAAEDMLKQFFSKKKP